MTIDRNLLPGHVAIIMDGNGRWAQKRMLPRSMGHKAGVEQVRTIVKMSSRVGIRTLTLYAFSTENWKRPKDEVGVLMQLLIEYLKKEVRELNEQNVRFRSIGDRDALPKEVKAAIDEAEEITRDNTGLNLVVAINYGSRAEILRAAKKLAERSKDDPEFEINETSFAEALDTNGLGDVDLMIRTSGEQRISNYLLYQLAYAELYFTDVYWPDFGEEEFAKALESYAARDRRFGGVK